MTQHAAALLIHVLFLSIIYFITITLRRLAIILGYDSLSSDLIADTFARGQPVVHYHICTIHFAYHSKEVPVYCDTTHEFRFVVGVYTALSVCEPL